MRYLTEKQRDLVINHVLDESHSNEKDLLNVILSLFEPSETCKKMTDFFNIIEGNNYWISDNALELMEALLVPLVVLRSYGSLVDPAGLKEFEFYIENNRIEKGFWKSSRIPYDVLNEYLDVEVMIDLIYTFYRIEKYDQRFKKNHVEDLVRVLHKYGIDLSDETSRPSIQEVSQILSYSIQPWKTVLSEYAI